MTEDPFANNREGVSVTLKAGTDFDAPWLVCHGSVIDVYAQVVKAMGWEDRDDLAELTLAGLMVNAANELHGLYNAAKGLDATVTSNKRGRGGRPRSNPKAWQNSDGDEAPAEQKSESKEKTPKDIALEQIAACESTTALKRWWAEDAQGANIFAAEEEVRAAWKARGSELKAREEAK
jgi:hypothetical protein